MQNFSMGVPPKIASRPQARVLIRKMIYFYGPMLRMDVAESLSLTNPTITTNVNAMIAAGVLREIDDASQEGRVGRRASLVDIVPQSKYFIGLEVRQSVRRVCLTDYRGSIVYTDADEQPIPDYDSNIASACRLVRRLLDHPPVPVEKIRGLGAAIPGVVDWENGMLLEHRQYRWFNRNVREDIRSGIGFSGPIAIGNDANARALGAQLYRREVMNGTTTLAYLFIARGISCPFILRDSYLASHTMGIGELGYMILDPKATGDSLGLHGRLSSYAGERALSGKCAQLIEAGQAPVLAGICGGRKPDISKILAAQQQGEESVCALIQEALDYIAYGICNVCNFIQPDCLLVDARITEPEENRKRLLQTIDQNLMIQAKGNPRVIFVEADEYSGARCAAALAIRHELNQIAD